MCFLILFLLVITIKILSKKTLKVAFEIIKIKNFLNKNNKNRINPFSTLIRNTFTWEINQLLKEVSLNAYGRPVQPACEKSRHKTRVSERSLVREVKCADKR